MKGRLAIIAVGAIALVANEASAANSQHRVHIRQVPSVFAHTYGYAPRPTSQIQSLEDRYQHIYESESLGHQWFPNPDRAPPPPHD